MRMTNEELLWLIREKFDAMNQAETLREYDALDAECEVLLGELYSRGLTLDNVPSAGSQR